MFLNPSTNPLAYRMVIIEMDRFKPFDDYNQPAALPHLSFHGLTENIAVTYLDDRLGFVLKKLRQQYGAMRYATM